MSTLFKARLMGSIQWMCPNCAWIYGSKCFSWRKPRLVCHHCTARWMLGIAISQERLPINTAFKADKPWPCGPVNAFLSEASLLPATGKFTGSIEMVCPTCGKAGLHPIEPLTGVACCIAVTPIFYRLTVRSSHYGPTDWTPDVQSLQDDADGPDAQALGEIQ